MLNAVIHGSCKTLNKMKTKGDDFAFSGVEHGYSYGIPDVTTIPGLTKREYFAAMAMQGILASDNSLPIPVVAYDSIKMADALIGQLNEDNNDK